MKTVLLHGGKVSMHASIGRKGFAPGETITVHVAVDNKTTVKVTPRVSLHQVNIYMCGSRHKTIESVMSDEPIVGKEVQPHTEVEKLIEVKIPLEDLLSIQSSVIKVKYYVHVTLAIPHSFDLHLNIQVVVTSRKIIDQLYEKRNGHDFGTITKN